MEERDMSVGKKNLSVTKDILSRIFIILVFGLIFIAKKTGFFRKTIDKLEVDIAEEFTQRAFEEMSNGNHTFAAYFLNRIEFTLSSEHSEITDNKANSIQEIIYKKPYLDIIGEDFYEKSNYKVALIYFEHSLLFFKENTKTYYYIALCHYYLKNNNEALNFLKKANKKINRNKEYIYFYTGEILKLIDISQEKEITESFSSALKNNPKFILPKVGLSDFYFKKGDVNQSLQYSNEYLLQYFELEFSKLKEKDGSHGISINDMNRYNELYSSLYTFSLLNPKIELNIEIYQDSKYSRNIKYKNNIYKELHKNLDSKEKAILNLILAYGLNNEFDKAIFYCNELLNVNQENVIGMIEIAHYYKLNRNYNEAEVFFNKLITMLPEEKWIYYSLTQLYILTDRIFEIAKFSSKLEQITLFQSAFIKPIYIFQKNPLEKPFTDTFIIQSLIIEILNYPHDKKNTDRVYLIIECLKSNYNETGMTQLEFFLIMGLLNEVDEESGESINHFFKEEKYKNKLIKVLNEIISRFKSKFDIDLIDKVVGLAVVTETFQIIETLYNEFKEEIQKSNHYQVINNIGVGLRRNKNIEDACELFHTFENSESPEHHEILINLAAIYYFELLNPNKALEICNRILKINPKEIRAIEFLIHLYEERIKSSQNVDASINFKHNVLLIKYLKKRLLLIESDKEKIEFIVKLITPYFVLGETLKLRGDNKSVYSAIHCYLKALANINFIEQQVENINKSDSIKSLIILKLETHFQIANLSLKIFLPPHNKKRKNFLQLSLDNYNFILEKKDTVARDILALTYFNLTRINALQLNDEKADKFIKKYIELIPENHTTYLDAAEMYKILWNFNYDKYFPKWVECIKEATKLNADLTIDLAIEKIKKEGEIEKLIKSEKENIQTAVAKTRQDLLAFLSHTISNTLSTGPEIVRQTLSLAKKALDRDYEDTLSYKAFNNLGILFSNFTMIQSLFDTFKMYFHNEGLVAEEWNKPMLGDKDVKHLFTQAIQQNLARFLFSENLIEERKRVIQSSNPDVLKALRKNYLENILSQGIDKLNAIYVLNWCKENISFIELEINDSDTTFNSRGIHYSIIYSIIAETIFNALKYSNGEFPVQVKWERKDNILFFECKNHFSKESTGKSDSRTGLQFIEYLIAKLSNVRFSKKEQGNIFIAQLVINLNGENK